MDLEKDNGQLMSAGVKVEPEVDPAALPDLGVKGTEVVNAILQSKSPLAIDLDRHLTSIQTTLNEFFRSEDRAATLGALHGLSDKTLVALIGALDIPEQQRQKILADLLQGGKQKDAAVETIATALIQAIQTRDASLINIAEVLSTDQEFQKANPDLAARLLGSLRDITKALNRAKGEPVAQPMIAEFMELPIFSSKAIPTNSNNQGNKLDPLAPIVSEAAIATAVVIALANAAAADERKAKDLLERAEEEAERLRKAAEERIKSAIADFEARTGCDVPENFDVAYRTDRPSDEELRGALPEPERSEQKAA